MPNLDNRQPNSPTPAPSAAAGMETRRLIRYPLSYVKLALMDLAETLGGRCTRNRCELSGIWQRRSAAAAHATAVN